MEGMTKEKRRTYIGGSDTPNIMGLSKYKSPLDVYNEKTGIVPSTFTGNENTYWGNILEPILADEFQRRNKGIKVRRINKLIKHPKHNFILGHIDRRVVGRDEIVEIKTTNLYSAGDWEDSIPHYTFAQIQHYLYIMGYVGAYAVVLIGGQEYRQFYVNRSEGFIKHMEKTLLEFWTRIQEKDPPPARDLDEYSRTVNAIEEKVIVANGDIMKKFEILKSQNDRINLIKESIQPLKFKIAEFMGNSEKCLDTDGKTLVSYKTNTTGRFQGKEFEKKHPRLYKKFMSEPSGRTFRPNYK